MRRQMWINLLTMAAGVLALAHVGTARAQSEEEVYDRWIDYYRRSAAEYDIRLDADPEQPLELRPEPVHTYHHPDGAGLKEQLGSLFVWTGGGRPEVVGAIWSYPWYSETRRNIVHEFVSLSQSPLRAVRNDQVFWQPREAGADVRPIPEAPAPASSRGLRLAQMRALARQFSAQNHIGGEYEDLRLTAQPVYRYELTDESADDLVDGALFVFFFDWDPELFLLVEAWRDGDQARWYYASARFSDKELRLMHEELQVWSDPPVTSPAKNHFGAQDGPFYAVHGVDQHEIIPQSK